MSKVEIDIKALLEAGVHFGHKTSRWHPKMAKYIHSKRGDAHIIDLTTTVEGLEKALDQVETTVAKGGKVLIVGTKKQVKAEVERVAEATGQPYVSERWIGGVLTNSKTIGLQIRKLFKLEKQMTSGELEKRYNKLEVQRFQEEIDSLNLKYGGIKHLTGKPSLVFVTDAIVDKNAIKEAKVMGIPVIAIADTNVNPDNIDFVIPANDDALKGLKLILSYLEQAILNGQAKVEKPVAKQEKTKE